MDTLVLRTCAAPKCGKQFAPALPAQIVCGPACARRKVEADKKGERARDRDAKEEAKTLRELLSEAQTAFNNYIRYRDAGQNCPCGDPFDENRPGGSVDAGHFRSRAAAPHLRFNEDNVHGQHKNCNRPGGMTHQVFREALVARIGEARVSALETDNRVHKFTKEEAREVRDTYRQKLTALKKGAA